MTAMEWSARAGHLVQAVDFEDRGGWVLDSQFDMQMGAPYLLAHGLGVPVAEARTTIEVSALPTPIAIELKVVAAMGS